MMGRMAQGRSLYAEFSLSFGAGERNAGVCLQRGPLRVIKCESI